MRWTPRLPRTIGRRRPPPGRALLAGGAVAALLFAGCGGPRERPRGIILMIGDGFGFAHLALARRLHAGAGGRLTLESLPVTALVATHSASHAVTDSAAAATALAAGVKTDNRFVGLDHERRPVASLADEARRAGWRIGYVTTTRLTHATPAAFFAHVADREDEWTIAEQLIAQAPDVALGGGLEFFLPEREQGRRRDGRDLRAEARQAGITVWERGQALEPPPAGKLLGLFAHGHLAYALDDQRYPESQRDPTLERLTRLALAMLARDGQPFFLMVEGGRIDHAAHVFDAAGTAAETVEFDRAVAEVLRFQSSHPETLVLLTADHETGGLAVNDFVDWEALRRQRASVEWLAWQVRDAGAGADLLAEMTGVEDFADAELQAVRAARDAGTAGRRLGAALAARQGATWVPRTGPTKGHTGVDVPLYAGGPGAERFAGVLDNTDIAIRLAELLGWRLPAAPARAATGSAAP